MRTGRSAKINGRGTALIGKRDHRRLPPTCAPKSPSVPTVTVYIPAASTRIRYRDGRGAQGSTHGRSGKATAGAPTMSAVIRDRDEFIANLREFPKRRTGNTGQSS